MIEYMKIVIPEYVAYSDKSFDYHYKMLHTVIGSWFRQGYIQKITEYVDNKIASQAIEIIIDDSCPSEVRDELAKWKDIVEGKA